MKERCLFRAPPRTSHGHTLVELMVALSIGVVLAGGGVFLLIEAARENLRTVADATVEHEAALLQARLTRLLREMSCAEGAVYFLPAATVFDMPTAYHGLIVARGPSPDFPRAELRYDTANGRLWFRENRASASTEVTLFENRPGRVLLRQVQWAPGIKADGSTDSTVIRIFFRMDDDGFGRRPSDVNSSQVFRSFAVKMRNA